MTPDIIELFKSVCEKMRKADYVEARSDMLQALERFENSKPQTMNWIKTSDRLPQVSNDDEIHEVLLCNVGQLVRVGQLCKHHGEMVWECDRHIRYLERFSHWMPLPPAPDDQP